MATNNFLPFCPTDSGTNLLTQAEYAAATDRTVGNQPGVASAKLNNKALRQSTAMTAGLAQYLSNLTGSDVLDNGVAATLLATITGGLKPIAPAFQKFLSGSGTYNKTYVFTITSGSATAGATYTNNAITYTVVSTVASGTEIRMTGANVPEFSGTLTKSAGTGDATLTFFVARAPIYLHVRMVGGGGGGGGSGSAGGTAGGNGTASTFGTTLLSAGGGTGGARAAGGLAAGGAGGTSSLGTGPDGLALTGAQGNGNSASQIATVVLGGNPGVGTPFGGGGAGMDYTGTNGGNGSVNTGCGGPGGGGASSGAYTGGSGGAGGYVDAIIYTSVNTGATFAYAVGALGAGGTAGTGGVNAGNGGSGAIIVTEHFQ